MILSLVSHDSQTWASILEIGLHDSQALASQFLDLGFTILGFPISSQFSAFQYRRNSWPSNVFTILGFPMSSYGFDLGLVAS